MPTTNPVPSNDPTDLLFNAQKLDQVVNGSDQYYTDRLGVNRRTVEGISAAADVVLGGLGYAPPVTYAAGISLTLTTQTVEYAGEVYAPKVASLPFTTSTWATDSAKFRLIQGVAATDLAASGGSSMIGYMPEGTGAVATTVQQALQGTVSVMDFMTAAEISAVKTNTWTTVADVTTAFQAALNTGKGVYAPDGTYKITATLTIDTAGQSLRFQSRAAKILTATDITALKLNKSFIEILNGTIEGAALNTTSTSAGIQIYDCQRSRIAFTYVTNFGYGISGDGAVSNWVNRIDGCYLYLNKRAGVYKMGHGTTIVGGEIAGSVYGVLQADLQATAALAINRDYGSALGQCIQVSGCTIEGIGTGQVRTITAAANNGSGLIRITSASHGFSTGDIVSVHGVVGTTEANGLWPINVIDTNTFDLKASTFTNAYTSGGAARRGVGVYVGTGQVGVQISDCYFESVPVAVQFGDAYKNNGTTAHTTLILGGSVKGCFLINNNTNGCLVATGRTSNITVTGNSGFSTGYTVTLLNSINDNYNGQVANFNNYGFDAQYALAGTQAVGGMFVRPVTKNNGIVFEVQVPTSTTSASLSTAFRVVNNAGVATVQTHQMASILAGMEFGVGGPRILSGTGTPEGVVTAGVGSLFLRSDGGAGTSLYVKQSGTGNTGWVGK